MFPENPLHWLDWAIIWVIGISSLLSLLRGFVKEAMSLAAWVLGFLVATSFAGQLALLLENSISNAALRYTASYAMLFLASLILGSLISSLLRQVVSMTGLSGLDRLLGVAFGFSRGLLMVVVLTYMAQLLLPVERYQGNSILLPRVMLLVQWAEQNFSTAIASAQPGVTGTSEMACVV
ncbi:MAG: CvpA family protein [Halieaceae bacterium]|nr:CvpA family protein [Halieaceae bacterium]